MPDNFDTLEKFLGGNFSEEWGNRPIITGNMALFEYFSLGEGQTYVFSQVNNEGNEYFTLAAKVYGGDVYEVYSNDKEINNIKQIPYPFADESRKNR